MDEEKNQASPKEGSLYPKACPVFLLLTHFVKCQYKTILTFHL